MKFKLKFEIVYPANKGIARDMKIQNVLVECNTEVESEYPIPTPSREDIIILGGSEYVIRNVKHKLDNDFYITIIEVENRKLKLEEDRRRRELEIESMMDTFSFK